MANDLRWPELADLKWIDEPDPPMVSVLPTKRNIFLIFGGVALLAIVFALLLIFFKLK